VIYTRKSTDEGLDQAFNSLDAQREACAAFIQSQKHEGWAVSPTLYDDGGFSGGSLERPALKRLLADIEAGLVDVIVVYKVDRLTRALSDFAKLVEIFDRRLLKARILLKADVSEAGEGWSDSWIIQALDTSASMIYRVRKQLAERASKRC
jgi:DNA invertase Pin-like site-specific DNA recombinase